MKEIKRSSGILMPLPSLPSPYGIGTIGKEAREFIDFLSAAGQKYWQLLPLGPTGFGDSPYSSFSTFAGNPYLIDLDILIDEGLLDKVDVNTIDWGCNEEYIDYGKIYANRENVLKKAYRRIPSSLHAEIGVFAENNLWLENYAVFMALKHKFNMSSWIEWPDEKLVVHDSIAIRNVLSLIEKREDLKKEFKAVANELTKKERKSFLNNIKLIDIEKRVLNLID